MNKTKIQFSFKSLCILLLILSGCNSVNDSPADNSPKISVEDFPNVLNLRGLPDSTTDRSVFAFSDLGSWHGYALPPKEDDNFRGSFIGPFTMTQDNGIWLSQCLSKMEIVNHGNEELIDFSKATNFESHSYPNTLKQSFQIVEPKLKIETELIFISNRTALVKVKIQNQTENPNLNLSLRWSGDSFLEEVSFSKHSNGVLIGFGKNENVGWISTNASNETDYKVDSNNYNIDIPIKELASKGVWETYLSQSFCFSEKEREIDAQKLEEGYKNPNLSFQKNNDRWNGYLEGVIENLHPEFNSEAHQRIAVKCLQTLNNNRRSAAGFLKHEGLFPSYNYEWFNGFWSWDSWKHAVAIAYYDTQLAQNQIRAMYDFQDEYGMVADCVYRDTIIENHNWRDTKPPLSAWAVWEVFQHSKDEDFLRQLFPQIEKYHNWWYKFRDINQNGLCEYGSTDGSLIAAKWESGMDNAVRFDDTEIISNNLQGGSMNRESVDLNAYLYAEKNYLAKIARQLGEKEKSETYNTDAVKLLKDILEKFYNEEEAWFFDYNLSTESHSKVFGAEGWIPLWAKVALIEQGSGVMKTMIDTSKFATYIPFPTLAADHPKFKPNRGYWRGPVWLDQAWFAITALRNYGYEEEAIQFSHQLFDRLEGLKNDDLPIRENYHPLTGEGMESNHFSWSAAHLLMLLMGR